MIRGNKGLLAGFVLLFVLLFPLSVLAAGEPINLQISPLPIELNVAPGHSVNADLRVRNAGPTTQKLQVSVVKVSADNNGGVNLNTPVTSDDFVKWISFSKTTFDAPPNEWQTINMTINVPTSAAFGYYFAVEFMPADKLLPQPGKTVANGAIANFVLLNVISKDAKREAQLKSFTIDRKLYEFLPIKFTAKVQATGNVHVAPKGNIFIMRGSKQVSVIDINDAGGNILPNSSRYFDATWDDGFPVYEPKVGNDGKPIIDQKGHSAQSLKWDFSKTQKLRIGRYTAHLVMVYDNGQRDVPMEASVSFWVIPWRVIAAGLLVGVFVAIGLLSSYKKFAKFWKRFRKKN